VRLLLDMVANQHATKRCYSRHLNGFLLVHDDMWKCLVNPFLHAKPLVTMGISPV
jgi:hypothetical protein